MASAFKGESDSIDRALTDQFRSIMRRRGVTVRELAGSVGVPYRTLQNHLLGKSRWTASIVLVLSALLEIQICTSWKDGLLTLSFEDEE